MTDSVGFLLNDTARLYRRTLDGMLRDLGMTSLQWRTVARLADSGMVCRKPDPNDRRAWNLYLTDKTDGLIRQLEVEARRVEDHAFAGLSEDEREVLAGLVERVRANLSRKEAVDA